MLKIDLFLLGEKGYQSLIRIIEFDKNIIGNVQIGKDKNVKNDFSKEIEKICIDNKIQYNGFSEEENYKLAIGWRWLIKDSKNLIVLHDSLLPKYRGFAPLVNGLINGEKIFGVTALFANSEYDKGEIITQKYLEIEYPKKINELISEISQLYAEISLEIAQKIKKGQQLKSIVQNEEEATYSIWRDEKDYNINWDESADKIKRFIDAVGNPYLGAITYLNGERIRLDEVEEYPDVKIRDRENNIGKVIFMSQKCPIIICKKGLLKIKKGIFLQNDESILPLKKFRSRFGK